MITLSYVYKGHVIGDTCSPISAELQIKKNPYLDSPENVFNFFPDLETDMEISSHRELTFRMELDRSLNFVVSGLFWLKFEPCGALCKKIESATPTSFKQAIEFVPVRPGSFLLL